MPTWARTCYTFVTQSAPAGSPSVTHLSHSRHQRPPLAKHICHTVGASDPPSVTHLSHSRHQRPWLMQPPIKSPEMSEVSPETECDCFSA